MDNLIVISSNDRIKDEALLINELFNAGMQLFHLRKKTYSGKDLIGLMNDIDEKYYPQIVLHQHPALLQMYGLKGFHFNQNYPFDNYKAGQLKKTNHTISISSHSICDLGEYEFEVDYQFISPIYQPISKPGYVSKLNLSKLSNYFSKAPKCKIYALGGIEPGNINTTLSIGFYGVAVLGYLWENIIDHKDRITIVDRFLELKEKMVK